MQEKKNKDKTEKNNLNHIPANETFALAGGQKDPKTGTTVPTIEGVVEAKEFTEGNKK